MKNIMLAVTGLSPQVITETLYALNQMNRPVHAIHIVTTRLGKDKLLAELLDGGNGPFYRYLEEYGAPEAGIDFGPGNIYAVRNGLGMEIEDIVDENDNACILRQCMSLAFNHTRNADTAVFFSIAGGRKTMGACLTLAAQMYGRPQDRLYHVLVPTEFESNRYFFYPPKKSRPIKMTDRQGHTIYKATKYARINLVHIPFFSIRSQLSPEILDQPRDPASLMLSLIREEPQQLTINLNEGKIRYCRIELDMMPNRLALYAFFALLKKECPSPDRHCVDCDQCFLDHDGVAQRQSEITRLYKQVCGTRPIDEMSKTGIRGLDLANFKSLKSRIREDLIQGFGPLAAEKIEIAATGKRPYTRYGIRLEKEAIEVVM